MALAAALGEGAALVLLDLAQTGVTTGSACELLGASADKLRELVLYGNTFGNDGE